MRGAGHTRRVRTSNLLDTTLLGSTQPQGCDMTSCPHRGWSGSSLISVSVGSGLKRANRAGPLLCDVPAGWNSQRSESQDLSWGAGIPTCCHVNGSEMSDSHVKCGSDVTRPSCTSHPLRPHLRWTRHTLRPCAYMKVNGRCIDNACLASRALCRLRIGSHGSAPGERR